MFSVAEVAKIACVLNWDCCSKESKLNKYAVAMHKAIVCLDTFEIRRVLLQVAVEVEPQKRLLSKAH